MAHRQDPEQESTVEPVRLSLELGVQIMDPPLDFREDDRVGALVVEHPGAERLKRGQSLTAHLVGRIPGDLIGHLLQAWERRSEDHAGLVPDALRQRPPIG